MKLSIFLAMILSASFAFGQADTLKKHVETLATFDGRKSGSENCNKAAEYLKTTLESYGLQVEYQKFSYQGKVTQNLVTSVGSGPIVIVGAHYDGQGKNHPSADDNASGCAVLLDLARSIKKMPAWGTVVFVLFSGEEDGLVGSAYYVDHPMFPKGKPDIKAHRFAINLDMIGHLKKPAARLAPVKVPEALDLMYAKYPFARDVTLRSSDPDNDGYSFLKKGLPIVFIHTGLHNRYHKPTDTPDSLNFDGMAQIEGYVEELIRTVTILDVPTAHLDPFEYKP